MRNITVSVEDDTYRRSRIRAAEMETRGGFRAADNVGRGILHHRDAIR